VNQTQSTSSITQHPEQNKILKSTSVKTMWVKICEQKCLCLKQIYGQKYLINKTLKYCDGSKQTSM